MVMVLHSESEPVSGGWGWAEGPQIKEVLSLWDLGGQVGPQCLSHLTLVTALERALALITSESGSFWRVHNRKVA